VNTAVVAALFEQYPGRQANVHLRGGQVLLVGIPDDTPGIPLVDDARILVRSTIRGDYGVIDPAEIAAILVIGYP
jgi:hypothetical protein